LLYEGGFTLLEAVLFKKFKPSLGQDSPVVGAGRTMEGSPTPAGTTSPLCMMAP